MVFAVGGPGGLYQTSVYPAGPHRRHRPGAAGRRQGAEPARVAVRPGLDQVPLERVRARTCRSIPRFISTAADGVGDEREFLREYFDSAGEMNSLVFLKGYQWPFDSRKVGRRLVARRHPGLHRDGAARAARLPRLPPQPGRVSLRRPERRGAGLPDQVRGACSTRRIERLRADEPRRDRALRRPRHRHRRASRWRSPSAPSTTTAGWPAITGGNRPTSSTCSRSARSTARTACTGPAGRR